MEFAELIKKRYATKVFDGRKVPEERIRQLLDMVRWAPSGLNLQPWRIKIVDDPGLKDELAAATYDEPQIRSCSHLLVFCADSDLPGLVQKLREGMVRAEVPERTQQIVNQIAAEMATLLRDKWVTYAQCQVYLALSYALLGAAALGLDSCPMTHFEPAEYSRILSLPENLIPTVLCPIGYAADEPLPRWRYSVEEILV